MFQVLFFVIHLNCFSHFTCFTPIYQNIVLVLLYKNPFLLSLQFFVFFIFVEYLIPSFFFLPLLESAVIVHSYFICCVFVQFFKQKLFCVIIIRCNPFRDPCNFFFFLFIFVGMFIIILFCYYHIMCVFMFVFFLCQLFLFHFNFRIDRDMEWNVIHKKNPVFYFF